MNAEDLLNWLGQHSNYELSFEYDPDEQDYYLDWQVHKVNGGRNDREWTLIGQGATPLEALRNAYNNS